MDLDLANPVELARALIRCPSVTPENAGALDVLQQALQSLGFTCTRLPFGDVDNLYARRGTASPAICFAGHTDVVPVGRGWSREPFAAEVDDGTLFGRGAADMKGAIGAFVAAVARLGDAHPGSISLLITGDEEGPAVEGTVKVLDWMTRRGETIDQCIVGEPTNPGRLGEMIKIGRRGSLNGRLTVFGTQGHVAYPDRADNPIPRALTLLRALSEQELDRGTDHFQPSNLEIVTVDVGNQATNVIPARVTAGFNVRFNDTWTGEGLEQHLRALLAEAGGPDGAGWDLEVSVSGESFVTPPGPLSDALSNAVEAVTGRRPELSTTGGTSDARFIKNHAPVAEFGLVGRSMHKADENVALDDLEALTEIYRHALAELLER